MSLTRAFWLGLLTGNVYLWGTLYWLSNVMTRYGDINLAGSIVINAVFIAYLALYPALFAVVVRRLLIAFGPPALVAVPFVWTATELRRMYVFTGFPWVLLGYSQTTVLPIAQAASVVGVFGVSAIVAATSAALAGIVVARAWRPAAIVLAGVLLIAVWGNVRARTAALTRAGEPIRVGIVQPNTLEEDVEAAVRDPAKGGEIVERNLSLTREALAQHVSLVLWPESGLAPYTLEDFPTVSQAIRDTARNAGVPILIGSDQLVWRTSDGRRALEGQFNAAFLIRADGTTGAVYRKIHLVPWGEYVPLRNWLTFVGPLVR